MEKQGPFDRILQTEQEPQRDPAATIIVAVTIALGVILLVLVLPPISILEDGEEPAFGPIVSDPRTVMPLPPSGFEAVSRLHDIRTAAPPRGSVGLSVPLSVRVAEGAPLLFFTYRNDAWQQLGAATAVSGGSLARGDLAILPANVAVFRPIEQTRAVLGSLPLGASIDEIALAVLTTLNPKGFVPTQDGQISGGLLPLDLQVALAPTISALTSSEIETLNTILASADLQSAHIQAILELVNEGGFTGIDLDYRFIDPSLDEDFVSFVEELSIGLHAEGHTLSLTLPLPERQGDEWNTLGYSWAKLAAAADAVKLTPVQDQGRYFQRMEETLMFLVSRVPSSKLYLPVSSLSYERGALGVRTLNLTEALTIASTPVAEPRSRTISEEEIRAVGQNLAAELGGSPLRWDDAARAVVFSYAGLGGQRTVWISNVFSAAFKLDLARRFQLGGITVEDVSAAAADANIWPAVQQYTGSGEMELVRPNGELLRPHWLSTGGTLEDDAGVSVTWRAPVEPGTYTLTLIVSDGVLRVGQRLLVEVELPQGAAAR